jgi:hypothetical protein
MVGRQVGWASTMGGWGAVGGWGVLVDGRVMYWGRHTHYDLGLVMLELRWSLHVQHRVWTRGTGVSLRGTLVLLGM